MGFLRSSPGSARRQADLAIPKLLLEEVNSLRPGGCMSVEAKSRGFAFARSGTMAIHHGSPAFRLGARTWCQRRRGVWELRRNRPLVLLQAAIDDFECVLQSLEGGGVAGHQALA